MLRRWRAWRRIRQLEREQDAAYLAWRRALDARQDIYALYSDVWEWHPEIDRAYDRVDDTYQAYAAARDAFDRARHEIE